MADLFADFPGPVLIGFPSGHTLGPQQTLPFGVRARVVGDRRAPRLVIEEPAVSVTTRVHLIGICGTAMATLAAMLKTQGARRPRLRSGRLSADERLPRGRRAFRSSAATAPEHITADLDLVVVGNAISRGNPELEEVLDRKIRYCSLPEAIREHFLWGARSIVLAGTHGKTTTTSLTGWVLTHAGVDPSVLVGGIARNFGEHGSSYRMGQGRDFVIEGDEYDSAFFDKTAKFLKYLPDIAVINNIEFDHADIYADFDAVTLAFRRLVDLVPRRGLLLIGADSPAALALAERAVSRVADVRHGARSRLAGARPRSRRRLDALSRSPPGSAVRRVRGAAARRAQRAQRTRGDRRRDRSRHRRRCGFAEGLRTFAGVKRRLEVVGTADGVTVYDDFAHHPTAVAETLAGLRAVESVGADLGRVRAALGVLVPARVPGRFRAGVRGAPTKSSSRRCSARRCRKRSGCRCRSSCATCARPGSRPASRHRSTRSSTIIQREHRPGDLVVLMSNGGFGGIHGRCSPPFRPTRSMTPVRIVPAGDAVLVAEFDDRIDAAVNARAIAVADAVRSARVIGVRDVVPTFRSVAVYFDPLAADVTMLEALLRDVADCGSARGRRPRRRLVEIPVCYDREFATRSRRCGGVRGPAVAGRRGSHPQRARPIACSCSGSFRDSHTSEPSTSGSPRRAARRRACRCCRFGRDRRRADRRLPAADAGRLEHHRPHADADAFDWTGPSRRCSGPATRCVSVPIDRAEFDRIAREQGHLA